MTAFLAASGVVVFPEISVLDAKGVRIERVVFDACLLLSFIVSQRLERRFAHKEQDQDRNDVEPGHESNADIAKPPGKACRPYRTIEHGAAH